MKIFLNGKIFAGEKAVKIQTGKFFANKSQMFYECSIMELVEKWQKIIDNNSQYIIN